MATSVELPTKREYDSDSSDEVAASKRAKAVVTEEVEESSDDESMSERSVPDDEFMPDRDSESESDDEFEKLLRKKESEDIVREFKFFFELKGQSDRTIQVKSEKDARGLFTKAEMAMFRRIYWDKWWHIRKIPDGFIGMNFTEYQLLAIYPSYEHYFHDFDRFYFTYEFDCAYPKFAQELSKTIQWGTTLSDALPIAEAIWKKHMPDVDVDLELLHDSVETAISDSDNIQFRKELILLFVNIYKREVDGKDYVQALKEIIEEENGLACYPSNKDFIKEEALEKRESSLCLLSRYCCMKRLCNLEKGEALEDNMLKDRITSFLELCLQDSYGYKYTQYVNEKIRIALKLGILSRHNEEFIEDAMTYFNRSRQGQLADSPLGG